MRPRDALNYLYRNPKSGVYTGYWACERPRGPYVGLWPPGLIERIFQITGQPDLILEPFAGLSKLGVSVDINPKVRPDIRADAQKLPIRDDIFDMVLMDPPYEPQAVRHYSDLWQTEPRTRPQFRFYHAWKEGARVTRPGGYLVLLHFIIPKHPGRRKFRRVATIGISTGPNKRIRCLSIFRKSLQVPLTRFLPCPPSHGRKRYSTIP